MGTVQLPYCPATVHPLTLIPAVECRKAEQGNHFRGVNDQYSLRPADCRVEGERENRVGGQAACDGDLIMTPIGEVLMDAVAVVKDKSS
jgi:hypothetical protein